MCIAGQPCASYRGAPGIAGPGETPIRQAPGPGQWKSMLRMSAELPIPDGTRLEGLQTARCTRTPKGDGPCRARLKAARHTGPVASAGILMQASVDGAM